MRKVLYLLILLGLSGNYAKAQTFVTHTTGSTMINGVQVTVTPINSPTTVGAPVCGLAPYYIGNNGVSGYRFSFNPAITHVRARFYELHSEDSIRFSVNTNPINLANGTLTGYAGPCGASNTAVIGNGMLTATTSQSTGLKAGAEINYQNSPGTITSITIRQTELNADGAIMDFWFKRDTCDQDFEAWADTPVCRNRPLQLNAYTYPNTTYSWTTTSTSGFTSNQQNPLINSASISAHTGTYTVTGTRGVCNYTKTFNVLVDNIPNKPTAMQTGPVCPNENDTLSMNTNIPGGGTFEFRGPNGQSISQQNNFLSFEPITPADVGTWKLFARTTQGCYSDTTDFNVITYNGVTADFDVDSLFGCGSDTINITDKSVGNTINRWNFGDGNTSFDKSPTHVYGAQGTYTITLIASNGDCADTTDKVVQMLHPLDALFDVDDDSICQGTPVIFTNASVTTPGTIPTYSWDFKNGQTSTKFDDTITFNRPGEYNVKMILRDYLGCTDSTEKVIVVDSIGSIDFTVSSDNICVGDAVDFKGTYSPQGNTSYTWNFDDGVVIPTRTDVRHVYELPKTSYTVRFEATYRICPTVFKTVPINVNPFPVVDLGEDTAICPNGEPLRLTDRINENNPNAKWSWNTPRQDFNASALIRHPGVYAVTVDINGCKTTDSVEVKKDCYVNIPNIFTPNGDGNNDYFLPRQLLSMSVTEFDMQIFNRWGEVIFKTDAINGRGWDGKVNGEFQPTGVYVYLIKVKFANGTVENYQGNVTMLR